MKKITLWFFTAAVLLFISTSAYAVPVGVFSWDESTTPGRRDFYVMNYYDSVASFFDVFVELELDSGLSLTVGIVDPNPNGDDYLDPDESWQTEEDLSGLNISSATLHLSFADTTTNDPLPDSITPLPVLYPCPDSDCTLYVALADIDYTTPVPEPATLILLGSGLAGLAGLALWRRRGNRV